MDETAENDSKDSCTDVLNDFLKDMNELDCQRSATGDSRAASSVTHNNTINYSEKRQLTQAKMKQTAKRKRPSWLRRREELVSLRQQAHDMETQIITLRFEREIQRRELAVKAEVQKPEATVVKEQQRQKKAQDENGELKVKLRSCVHILNALQATIAAASSQKQFKEGMASPSAVCAGMKAFQQLQISNPRTFKMLEDRVDSHIPALQGILDELQQMSPVVDSEQTQVYCTNGEASSMMEYKRTRILPFDEMTTSNAAWNIVKEGGCPHRQFSHVSKHFENGCALDSRFVMLLHSGVTMTIDTHLVIKRLVAHGSCVILAESCSEWSTNHAVSGAWRHTSQESIWSVFRRYPLVKTGSTPSCASGCQIKAVIRSKFARQTFNKIQNAASTFAPDLVASSFRDLIEAQRQFLENTLWDSVRARGK